MNNTELEKKLSSLNIKIPSGFKPNANEILVYEQLLSMLDEKKHHDSVAINVGVELKPVNPSPLKTFRA